jgi:hypothetical protein
MAKPITVPARARLIEALLQGGQLTPIVENGVVDRYVLIMPDGTERIIHATMILKMLDDGLLAPAPEGSHLVLTAAGRRYRLNRAPERKRPQAPPVSFYLGRTETYRRLKALDDISEPYGGRSRMLQMIADGKLKLVRQ